MLIAVADPPAAKTYARFMVAAAPVKAAAEGFTTSYNAEFAHG
jgi:hypothetical protein